MPAWLLVLPLADVGEMPFDGGSGGHGGAHEVRTSSASLASFKVAVARRGAPLAGGKNVRIHAETHGTSRLPPFETGFAENAVETFFLGARLDPLRSGNDHGVDG